MVEVHVHSCIFCWELPLFSMGAMARPLGKVLENLGFDSGTGGCRASPKGLCQAEAVTGLGELWGRACVTCTQSGAIPSTVCHAATAATWGSSWCRAGEGCLVLIWWLTALSSSRSQGAWDRSPGRGRTHQALGPSEGEPILRHRHYAIAGGCTATPRPTHRGGQCGSACAQRVLGARTLRLRRPL